MEGIRPIDGIVASAQVALDARVQNLQQAFVGIARGRMAGLPLVNPALAVEALGFAAQPDERAPRSPNQQGEEGGGGEGGLGVLLTPWFMNLVWLPLRPAGEAALPQGVSRVRRIGGERFEFIGAHEDQAGAYEMCSLFSPMFEFTDQAAARATALAVLAALRVPPAPAATVAPPPRRAFLFGRGAAAGSR